MRTTQGINRGWRAQARPAEGFFAPHFDDSPWLEVRIPHTNLELPASHFDPGSYRFATGYRRPLNLPRVPAGHRVFVVFEAVMARAAVWLDGEPAGEHRGGYTPFEVEVPPEVVARGHTVVAVLADADENPEIPPFGHVVDYLTYGGIYREVSIDVRPPVFLASATVTTPGSPVPTVTGHLEFSAPAVPGWAEVRVEDLGGTVLAFHRLTWTAEVSRVAYRLEVPGARPWTLDAPSLYRLRFTTGDDSLERPFGFRQAEFRAEGFFLNGQRVVLRGLNRHQSYPHAGYALPRRAQAADADLLKFTLGCTMVRSSHYPPSRHFLDRCDQIGLLVFEEIPGWQHIGGEAWKAVALQNLQEMVIRDRHRPSVVLWGVRINESADDSGFYRQTNALARRLDPSRPTGGVRNFGGSELLEDVYTYNDFVHGGTNRALKPRWTVARRRVPYLVTEHNGHMFPTKKNDPEARRVEHALRHARVQSAAGASRATAGALGWCLADYPTHGDFGSGDQVCHHGVVDQYRCFKPAADLYASQRAAPVFGRVASRMAHGEHDGGTLRNLWVFTNSAEVRLYQNDRPVGTFFPDRKTFPGLPHPPVPITDLVGPIDEPGLTPAQSQTVRTFFQAYRRRGGFPLAEALPFFWLMVTRGWPLTKVYDLYTRHVVGWGAEARVWRFEGWTNGQREWEQTLGPSHAAILEVQADTLQLQDGDCWDVVRVEVRLVDTHGNELWYGADPVTLEVDGPLRVIGPRCRPLVGGSTAFWVAATGPGPALVRARTNAFASATLALAVESPGVLAGNTKVSNRAVRSSNDRFPPGDASTPAQD